MRDINTSFNPLSCGEEHGYFEPLPMFKAFTQRHPELTARAAFVGEYMRDAEEEDGTFERILDGMIYYATTEVQYRRDHAGADLMELPREIRYQSPLTGAWITRACGDCEDIAAGQKHEGIWRGLPGERLRFVLSLDRVTTEPHMLLCAVYDGESSWLVDNRRMNGRNVNQIYEFIGVEQHQTEDWAWCREPTQSLRDLLSVNEEGVREQYRRSSPTLEELLVGIGRRTLARPW